MTTTWLITGTSRGFGLELARAALDAGDNVLATARRTSSLDPLVERYGSRVLPFELDVTDAAQARSSVETAVAAFGGLDVVVNNAGYANMNSIEDTPYDDFRAQVETDLWGVVNVTRAALPVFRERRAGHFIQFASIGGRIGLPGLGPYQVSKWAVEGFSEVLAKETAPFGVRVTIVEPGGFRTDWAGDSMSTGRLRAAYEPSVGAVVTQLRSQSGKQPGDPARAARILVDIAHSDDPPPLHLLLGRDALEVARAALDERRREDERWAPVTESTDFPDPPGRQASDSVRSPAQAV